MSNVSDLIGEEIQRIEDEEAGVQEEEKVEESKEQAVPQGAFFTSNQNNPSVINEVSCRQEEDIEEVQFESDY